MLAAMNAMPRTSECNNLLSYLTQQPQSQRFDISKRNCPNPRNLPMPSHQLVDAIRIVVEWAALLIELLGAAIIVAGVTRVAFMRGTIRYLFHLDETGSYDSYKLQLGRTLLLGLEFLVAGDVVRTVALEPTLNNVSVLGLLVAIRTFLSWSLVVELEGRWPWERRRKDDNQAAQ